MSDISTSTEIGASAPAPAPDSMLTLQSSALVQLVNLDPNSRAMTLTRSEWKTIDKEGLDNKPLIEHPLLGKVVEVRPGVFARRITPDEAYKKHLENFQGTPLHPLDDVERRRFSLMLEAKSNSDGEELARLKLIKSVVEFEAHLARDREKVKTMDDIAADPNSSDLLKHNAAAAEEIRAALEKDGRILKLPDGALIVAAEGGKKVLAREYVDQLRKEGMNVYVARTDDKDTYMKKITKDALNAMAFIEGKIELKRDEASGKVVDEEAERVAVEAATSALAVFEREKNVITRSDGEEVAVRLNLDAFVKGCKDAKLVTGGDIREFMHEHGAQLAHAIAATAADSNNFLIFTETLDFAQFVPRAYILFLGGQPSPRVVEFSRIYNVYRAAFRVLQPLCLSKNRKNYEKDERRKLKELQAMADTQKGDVVFPNMLQRDNARQAGSWTQTETLAEDVSEHFSRLRVAARERFFQKIELLQEWFELETRYHSRKADAEFERKIAQKKFAPIFTHDEAAREPQLLVLFFYRQMWVFTQQMGQDILRAHEFMLLLMLEKWLPHATADYWSSEAELPKEIQCPGVTKKLITENNGALTSWRTFDSPALKHALGHYMRVAPQLDRAFIDVRVHADQPWSPTYRQMIKFYRDMCSLFRLSLKDVKAISEHYHEGQRRKQTKAEKESLAQYMEEREAAEKKEVAASATTTTSTERTESAPEKNKHE